MSLVTGHLDRWIQISLVMVLMGCQSPDEFSAPPPDPAFQASALIRPTFETSYGEAKAGHAVLIDHGGTTLLLSAHHILGRPGGLKKAIGWQEVPKAVTTVTGRTSDGKHTFRSVRSLAIEGAKALDPKDPSTDLSAFVVEDSQGAQALTLASQNPETGDFVWLMAEVEGYVGKDRSLHRASVSASTDKELRYVFADGQLKLRATSGAAIIDKEGRLVAIHLGGGSNLGLIFGVGNPASSVRKRLDRALLKPAQ